MSIYYWYDKPPQPITTPWIYHSAELWLISLSSDWSNRITIADKNLWATTVYNDWDTLSQANCGRYYQWGNKYWFPRTWTVTKSSTRVNASSYWPWNYYISIIFITRSSTPYNWSSVRNDNLWGWVTWTNEAMQWPCPSWYHVPKNTERQAVVDAGVSLGVWTSSWGNNFRVKLKLPFAGYRDYLYSSVNVQGSYGEYWSSIAYNDGAAYSLAVGSTTLTPQDKNAYANGYSIRPFANTPRPPYEWENRTKLF